MESIVEVIKLLEEFISSSEKRFTANQWIQTDVIKVYVRKGRHYLDNKLHITLDIATIEVVEHLRRSGLFTRFVKEAHRLNPYDATRVECVHSVGLGCWLEKHGFHKEPDSIPGNYYIHKKEFIL